MVLYVDVQGTVVGNQDIAQADCLQAVADLSDAGFAVRLVSSLPGGVLGGRPIGDKGDAIAAVQPGDWWVDDDIAILDPHPVPELSWDAAHPVLPILAGDAHPGASHEAEDYPQGLPFVRKPEPPPLLLNIQRRGRRPSMRFVVSSESCQNISPDCRPCAAALAD